MEELFTKEEIAMVGRCGEVFAGEYADDRVHEISKPIILDIGANVGAFAIWAARYWPGCTVRMFEPNKSLSVIRQSNIAKVNGVRLDIPSPYYSDHNVGVSDRRALGSIYDMGKREDGMTTVLHGSKTPFVDTCGLIDAHDLPTCDILKLDCEGAECHVLTRYRHFNDVKAVLLEWHTIPNRVLAEYVLPRHGFHCLRGHGEQGIHEGFDISYGVQIWMR